VELLNLPKSLNSNSNKNPNSNKASLKIKESPSTKTKEASLIIKTSRNLVETSLITNKTKTSTSTKSDLYTLFLTYCYHNGA
jgi:hypothetical protein